MFWTKWSTETQDVPRFRRKDGNAPTGILRSLWTVPLVVCAYGMSQEIPSSTPATREVHFYPMLDANRVYDPGQKVKVEEPHGIYKGWILMDDYYFLRLTSVKETERKEEPGLPGSLDTKGSFGADVRRAISHAWEKAIFTYGCANRELKVEQIELARVSESGEFILGSHTSVCRLTTVAELAKASSGRETKHDSPSSPTVTWETIIPDQGFPAKILSTGAVSAKGTSQILCDPRSSFRVRVKSSAPATRIHVEVKVDGFFLDVSSCDAILENAGQQYVIAPTPRWDMHKLAFNDQPVPVTVVISVKADGVDLGQKTSRLQLRAVNDVPFAFKDDEGHITDQSILFAAFVNENSPVVEVILKEALQWGAVRQFVGYQRSAEDVRMQVFAIWNVLQRHNVKYSSITTPSGFSEKVRSQSVRFVDDTFRMSQANCVDGSVLFASVLYKISIQPVLVMKPGHMFVGYRVSPQGPMEFLETTMIGNGPPVLRDKPFPGHGLAYFQAIPTYREFAAATNKGEEEYRAEVQPKLQDNAPGYRIIDIRKAREMGISPIPR
jgi:hypothetical protein